VEIVTALLCDSASTREGLLHVLGGGITRLFAPEIPGAVGVTLAAMARMDEEELDLPHEVNFHVEHNGEIVQQGMGGLQVNRPDRLEDGERLLVPLVIPIGVPITSYGRYAVVVDIEGARQEVEFWVLHPDEQVLPPIG